jgi:hypothetical protein
VAALDQNASRRVRIASTVACERDWRGDLRGAIAVFMGFECDI